MVVNSRVAKYKEEHPVTFSEKYEQELIARLFSSKRGKQLTVEDVEARQADDIIIEKRVIERNTEHHKRSGLWDVPIDEEVKYFDPELSYEITGYRPISETEGLDFDPEPFCEVANTYIRTGKFTAFLKGSKGYVDFWNEQIKRCNEGYTVGKYRITGDNYFFINFYRMLIVDASKKAGAGAEESFPKFHVEQYKYFHYLEMCEIVKKDCIALKSRGVGFSEIGACLGVRPFITARNFTTIYTAFTDQYLKKVLEKCWLQLDWLYSNTDGGMKRSRQKINNMDHKRASLVRKDGTEFGLMNNIYGIVSDNPRKVRGDRVDRLMFEEAGSDPTLLEKWEQTTALVTVLGAKRGIKIAWGTGGDSGPALAGLSQIFNDPEAFGVLPYRNNYSDDGTYQLTGFFIPAYAFVLLNEFTDKRGVTDRAKAKEFYEQTRKRKSGDNLLTYCAEYCFTPSEALLKQGSNIFDAVAIADRLTQLRVHKMGVKPERVTLLWDKSNGDNTNNKIKVIEDPHSHILVYERPRTDTDGSVYRNLYVAGIDSIDQGRDDSATQNDVSDFCITIKRRIFGMQDPTYVCIYKHRPKDIREAYEITWKLLTWYNCKALLEHTKIGLLTYFREKKKDSLLMRRPRATLNDVKKGNSKMIGVPASESVIKHGLELINNFVNDYCYSINSDEMLEQLLKYSYELKRKFDIVAAMGMTEIADEEMSGLLPKTQESNKTAMWQDVGWYINEKGYKQYGVIPKHYDWARK